jgi:hypothetical protein
MNIEQTVKKHSFCGKFYDNRGNRYNIHSYVMTVYAEIRKANTLPWNNFPCSLSEIWKEVKKVAEGWENAKIAATQVVTLQGIGESISNYKGD